MTVTLVLNALLYLNLLVYVVRKLVSFLEQMFSLFKDVLCFLFHFTDCRAFSLEKKYKSTIILLPLCLQDWWTRLSLWTSAPPGPKGSLGFVQPENQPALYFPGQNGGDPGPPGASPRGLLVSLLSKKTDQKASI